jgi:hypothetical protein
MILKKRMKRMSSNQERVYLTFSHHLENRVCTTEQKRQTHSIENKRSNFKIFVFLLSADYF